MHLATVDLDDALVEQARAILGTDTVADTVDAALRDVIRRNAAVDLLELLKSDVIEIRDLGELRRRNWHGEIGSTQDH